MENPKNYYQFKFFIPFFVILIAGIITGLFYQKQKDYVEIKRYENTLEVLRSQVVPSIVCYGRVEKIDGDKITLAFNEDLITVKVKDNTQVHLVSDKTGNDNLTEGLAGISVGDMLNINLSLDSDGNFEGDSIINFSQNK